MASQTIAVINGTSRTFKHLIPQALARGYKVRAVVRSASRFLDQTKKSDDLSAHEWKDFNDIATLMDILDGVDVVYVALGASAGSILKPSYLNQDAVIAIGTALLSQTQPGSRSRTKLVFLSSAAVKPGEPARLVSEALIGNQFNDLRRTQEYLLKQASWLDVVYVAPGMLLDNEEESASAAASEVKLVEGEQPKGPLSYARLAMAMQQAATSDKWIGKFVTPIATTKVHASFRHFQSARETVGAFLSQKALPWLLKTAAFGFFSAAVGYIVGVREQGLWLANKFNVDLRQ